MNIKQRYRIGFLTPNLTPSFFWHQWHIIHRTACKFDTHLFTFTPFIFTHDMPYKADFFKSFELAAKENIDGLIISTGTLKCFYDLEQLTAFCRSLEGVPVVSFAEPLSEFNAVLIDNKAGMAALVGHFIREHGCRRLVFLRGPENNKEAENRFAAYRETLRENGILFREELVYQGAFTYRSGKAAICELLDNRKTDFDAVIAANDDMARGAFTELKKRNYSIPEDVAIGGFDFTEAGRQLDPPLTTVIAPLQEQADKAFEVLLALIEGKEVPLISSVPARVVIQASCGCAVRDSSPEEGGYDAHGSTSAASAEELQPLSNYSILKFRDCIGFFAAFSGVITVDKERMQQWLKSLFSDLEIPSYICSFYANGKPLYLDSDTIPAKRSLHYLATWANKETPDPEQTSGSEYNTFELIPDKNFFEDRSQSFICSEIQFMTEHYGFFVADVTSSDSLLIMLLKVQLSNFFHSVYVQNELERAYIQLKEATQAKTRFFMNVSHEIRTPLTMLLSPLESLMQGEYGENIGRTDDLFAAMHANASRLLLMMNNLLDFSRMEAGRLLPNKKKHSITRLLKYYFDTLKSAADNKGLSLVFEDNSDGEVFSSVDKGLLEQAVFNLIANAFKFTSKGGDIVIGLENTETFYRINVKDSGIGIPEDKLDLIFERFTQADDSISRQFGGTGIGLSFAREIVLLHGGQIEVESEVNRGSTFSIVLPFDNSATEEAGDDALQQMKRMLSVLESGEEDYLSGEDIASARYPERKAVLIVENNQDMRHFIKALMQKEYNVYTARNGMLGYKAVVKYVPDLIISDIMMPVMDGYTMTKIIKKDKMFQDIPIILLSAKAEVHEKLEGISAGADDYLTKPFHPLELKARVATQLRMKAFREEKTTALKTINRQLKDTITQLKSTQDQLIESEKIAALGGLVAGMAHEINTPVGISVTATSHLQQLARDISNLYKKNKMKRSDLESFFTTLDSAGKMILKNLQRADNLIRSFKQIAVDQLAEELREFNLKAYLQEIFYSLQPELKKKRHTVEIICPESLMLRNYPGAFSQVITNLVMNSIIHGYENEENGRIVCHIKVINNQVHFKYRDFGRGIEKEFVDKIFNPFFTTRRNKGGTGLGMHLVFNLLTQKMGGKIRHLDAQGKGAAFLITLPLAISEPPPASNQFLYRENLN